jgi:hypothetical protein
MPNYIVQGTHIKHGAKGATEAILYGPGDAIELTVKEAEALGASVVPAPKGWTPPGGPTAAQDGASSGAGSSAGPEGEGGPGAGKQVKAAKNKGGE